MERKALEGRKMIGRYPNHLKKRETKQREKSANGEHFLSLKMADVLSSGCVKMSEKCLL